MEGSDRGTLEVVRAATGYLRLTETARQIPNERRDAQKQHAHKSHAPCRVRAGFEVDGENAGVSPSSGRQEPVGEEQVGDAAEQSEDREQPEASAKRNHRPYLGRDTYHGSG